VALALAQSQRQRYLDLFEQAPDGYLVTNIAGIISEANRAAAKLLNVEARFLVGKPLSIFFTKEVRQTLISKLNSICSVDFATEWEVSLVPRSRPPIDAAISVACLRASSGEVIELRWLLRDLSERKRTLELEQEIAIRDQVESQLRHSSLHDALTGLPNRALFINRLKYVLEYSKQHSPYLFAVLFIDLDRFKVVNDSLGHSVGDQLLITTAKRLLACLRPTDTAARLGGDEFTILLEGIKNVSDAISVAERLQTQLKLPLTLSQQEVFTSASIGIALSASSYDRTEDLLRDADTAMYRAKSLGGARTEIFSNISTAEPLIASKPV
ncbi:MAG TPA: diguanylate cyclase, partial [Leptolyngbyaceae cyanobacterium]